MKIWVLLKCYRDELPDAVLGAYRSYASARTDRDTLEASGEPGCKVKLCCVDLYDVEEQGSAETLPRDRSSTTGEFNE